MPKDTELYPRLDARLAGWVSSSPPSLVAYQLRCGTSLPQAGEKPHGRGEGWMTRATAAVLRGCYAKGLRRPRLEQVEAVALSVLPEPEQDEEGSRMPGAHSAHARWEQAVEKVSQEAHRILSCGPASGVAGGEVLYGGGVLEATVLDLPLQQRVDLLWRRPDGALEAVLVLDEPRRNEPPAPARHAAPLVSDWRCVLATAVVAELYGESPDLHLIRLEDRLARIGRLSEAAVVERLSELARVLDEARGAEGMPETEEAALYPLDPGMLEASGGWHRREEQPPFGRRPRRR